MKPNGSHGSGTPIGRRPDRMRALVVGLLLVSLGSGAFAALPDWAYRQELTLSSGGLHKISLPDSLLNAARPGLEDLRLLGPDGQELPFLIERGRAAAQLREAPVEQTVRVEPDRTRVVFKRRSSRRLVGLTLQTSATDFLKSVTVEAQAPGGGFEVIADHQPVFRQADGVSQLFVPVPSTTASSLVVTLDDRRNRPIAVLGVSLHELESEPPPDEPVNLTVRERVEAPGETRLIMDLGAANLALAELRLETPEPLFTRRLTLLTRQMENGELRDRAVALGTVYRVALNGGGTATQLAIPIEAQVDVREVVLQVENGDSPPLALDRLRLTRRPAFLVFWAPGPARFGLFAGNSRAAAPRYDVALLAANLKGLAPTEPAWSTPGRNPDFRPSDTLPSEPLLGAAIEVREWAFRKPVSAEPGGVVELELDLEVLARAAPGLADLRLVSAGCQVPYVIDRTAPPRSIHPALTGANDPKKPGWSRWMIRLPQPSLPLSRLVFEARTPLFTRELRLSEDVADERGSRTPRQLGTASWRQTPDRALRQFTLTLDHPPQTDTLYLETHDGDNPPIALTGVKAVYPVTRLVFRPPPGAAVHLYYGHRRAAPPAYDLSLVAGQILASPRSLANAGVQEQLRRTPWSGEAGVGGGGTVVLWVVLAGVVIGLLVIIARLLPAGAQSDEPRA